MATPEQRLGEKQKCSCGSTFFKVFHRVGAGGSGEYVLLICTTCTKEISLDFDNPNYEG